MQWLFLKKFKQSGHKVIHDGLRHYMDLVSKEDAQRYFAITPQTVKI